MERTVEISGQSVKLISSGASPLIYKATFGHDFFKDFSQVIAIVMQAQDEDKQDQAAIELLANATLLQHYVYVYAKNANNNIAGFDEWLSGFSDFPVFDFAGDLLDLMMNSISSKKNSMSSTKAMRSTI